MRSFQEKVKSVLRKSLKEAEERLSYVIQQSSKRRLDAGRKFYLEHENAAAHAEILLIKKLWRELFNEEVSK